MSHEIHLFLGCGYLNSQEDASPFFTVLEGLTLQELRTEQQDHLLSPWN